MPLPSSPPYVSATLPRQLNRWLDINAQNGPLGRTQSYITLPSFSADVEWQGYSDIVAAFNFEGSNNFSLRWLDGNMIEGLGPVEGLTPNYFLCVMWIDSSTTPFTVHRYAIWNGVGEVMYIPVPLYTGQLIKKNFRLEVWSVAGEAIASQAAAINIYTSKYGILDYRYGLDFLLVGPDPIVTQFSEGTSNLLLPTDMGILLQAGSEDIVTVFYPSWADWITHPTRYTPFAGTHVSLAKPAELGGLKPVINITNNDSNITFGLSQPLPFWGIQSMVLCCKMVSDQAVGSFLFSAYPTGIAMFWNDGVVTTGGSGPSVVGLGYGIWYTFVLFLNGGAMSLYVYDTATGTLLFSNTSLAPAVTFTNTLVLGNAGMEIAEFAVGANTLSNADLSQINQYMFQKYFGNQTGFSLPFTWPAGATPQLN